MTDDLTFFLSFILFISSALAIIFLFIGTSVHKSMTLDHCTSWDYSTFGQFKKEFYNQKWEPYKGSFESSFFCRETDSKIHADLIRFNGKGMVLKHIHYLRYVFFMRFTANRLLNNRKRCLWA